MMNGLDLFSGYGGITVALRGWVVPIAYCEIERYATAILLSRMSNGELPLAPIWDDVRTLSQEKIKHPIDIIYGGFPCQDISVAGVGKGLEGKRSGLFFELLRLVKEINPLFVFLENVPAIRTKGLTRVISELTDLGYDCRWTSVSAKEVGAPHLRKRWFLLAHSNGQRLQGSKKARDFGESWQKSNKYPTGYGAGNGGVSNSKCNGCNGSKTVGSDEEKIRDSEKREKETLEFKGGSASRVLPTSRALQAQATWEVEPPVGRVVDGCENRTHRIKALGNGVVPLQVKKAFERLMGFEWE